MTAIPRTVWRARMRAVRGGKPDPGRSRLAGKKKKITVRRTRLVRSNLPVCVNAAIQILLLAIGLWAQERRWHLGYSCT